MRTGVVRLLRFALTTCVIAACAPLALAAQVADSAWTIRSGTFAGQKVGVDPAAASKRSSKFWRTSDIDGRKRIVGWNPSKLPVRVAFRAGRGISSQDSIAFWEILQQMQNDIGMRLFEPATLEAGSDPDDIIVIDTRSMAAADGLTLVTWTISGSLYDARVYFRTTEILHNPRVVTHEMMHALGFGHTSAWISVMNGYGGSPRGLTPADVAYAQVALEARAAGEREDMWARLALAVGREPEQRGLNAAAYAGCTPTSAAEFGEIASSAGMRADDPELLTAFPSCNDR
ncbi:MAG TPA: hypothetical protein VHM24_13120 [Gemmatimonadaceae bacterium]|nr:hypothetical protein [Gemmatimonadaceae bacterium]